MSQATALATIDPPAQKVRGADAPVKVISADNLKQLGQNFGMLFNQYVSDRRIAELRWLRNQRQYLGIYDPEVEREMDANRSKAYPRITRVKCISVLSRIMNLMFQGNERNWELKAAPWPDMTVDEVKEAIAYCQKLDQDAGVQADPDLDYVMAAVSRYSQKRAEKLSTLLDDQLQELGGNQSIDYVSLNRAVLKSGVLYGLGVLRGPFVRECEGIIWDETTEPPTPKKAKVYKPQFEFLPIWDFYPDMSAKTLTEMDGYFTRSVMSRAQLRALGKKPDFFEDQIKQYLMRTPMGNYRPQPHETELRSMGVKVNVNEMKSETSKYEIITWHGKINGQYLALAGVDVPEDKMVDDLDAELWMVDSNVIGCRLNPWVELDVDMPMIHSFLFDEDDTSPVGFGLPNAIRDSQMMVAAATRMLLDNASVVCGPNIELNTDLLRPDQDLSSVGAYKVWYREGSGVEAQFPAVRNVQIDAHMDSLLKVIDLGLKFADAESFVNPSTGGDQDKMPSEPLRTAAGASMLRGDAALPFKDVIRSFDRFTMSVIQSLVIFNRKFNPNLAPDGEYDVIARGATSLMAKELRGMQADNLAMTLKPEEMIHIDERKLVAARIKARDMDDILVPEDEAARRITANQQAQSQQQDQQNRMIEATIRKTAADAFKDIAGAQKNIAAADAQTVNSSLDLLERGINNGIIEGGGAGPNPGPAGQPGQPGDQQGALAAPGQAGGGQGGADQVPPGQLPSAPGGGAMPQAANP